MIIGIGIDLVEIARMERAFQRFGDRFLLRFLTEAERASLPARPAAYMAGRFAAKEAAVKALGTGFAKRIGPRQIETFSDVSGKPGLRLLGEALVLANNLGVRTFSLSISHERSMAVAMVILED